MHPAPSRCSRRPCSRRCSRAHRSSASRCVAALLAPLSIGGWNLAFGTLAPDFSRLSPIKGFGRIFSMRGLVELVKAFAKFGIVALIAVIFLWSKTKEMVGLGVDADGCRHRPRHHAERPGADWRFSYRRLALIAGNRRAVPAVPACQVPASMSREKSARWSRR